MAFQRRSIYERIHRLFRYRKSHIGLGCPTPYICRLVRLHVVMASATTGILGVDSVLPRSTCYWIVLNDIVDSGFTIGVPHRF